MRIGIIPTEKFSEKGGICFRRKSGERLITEKRTPPSALPTAVNYICNKTLTPIRGFIVFISVRPSRARFDAARDAVRIQTELYAVKQSDYLISPNSLKISAIFAAA